MGYTTERGIRKFWPDNTDRTKYIYGGASLSELIDTAQQHWPGCDLENIVIDSEYIHTDCLGYDLFDPGDWSLFITITNTAVAE